jgi:hypothetical protein
MTKLLHTLRVRSRDCAFGGAGDVRGATTVRTRQTALRSDVALQRYRLFTVAVGRRWLLLLFSMDNMSLFNGDIPTNILARCRQYRAYVRCTMRRQRLFYGQYQNLQHQFRVVQTLVARYAMRVRLRSTLFANVWRTAANIVCFQGHYAVDL